MTRRATAALAALGVLLLGGCTSATTPDPGTGSTPTATETPRPTPTRAPAPPPAPEADVCHALAYDDAVAPTASARTVPCTEDHTSQTFHVGALDRVVGGRLLAVDSRRLQEQAATECPERLSTLVGGGEEQQRLSMLRAVWFTPSVRQSDAGADWLRCDAIAVAGPERLLPLTGPVGGVLDTEAGRERYGMCGTAEPGTSGFERVACAEPHAWRALRTVALPGPDYPGEDAARAAGEDPCTAAARQQAADPLDFRWGYEWPTAEQWAGGQTYGLCWAPTD
jgi:hypothetical protein